MTAVERQQTKSSLFFQRAEGVLHVLQKLSVVGLDLGFAVLHGVLYPRQRQQVSLSVCGEQATLNSEAAHLEFHRADPVEDLSHVLPDHGPGDLVVALSRGLHRMARHVIERNRVGQNPNCLVERTEPGGGKRRVNQQCVQIKSLLTTYS